MKSDKGNKCYARGCTLVIHRTLLMCRKHWALVPPAIQKRVYDTYRNRDWNNWHKAINEARDAVQASEADSVRA